MYENILFWMQEFLVFVEVCTAECSVVSGN